MGTCIVGNFFWTLRGLSGLPSIWQDSNISCVLYVTLKFGSESFVCEGASGIVMVFRLHVTLLTEGSSLNKGPIQRDIGK